MMQECLTKINPLATAHNGRFITVQKQSWLCTSVTTVSGKNMYKQEEQQDYTVASDLVSGQKS